MAIGQDGDSTGTVKRPAPEVVGKVAINREKHAVQHIRQHGFCQAGGSRNFKMNQNIGSIGAISRPVFATLAAPTPGPRPIFKLAYCRQF
jgi:hypothetical protein